MIKVYNLSNIIIQSIVGEVLDWLEESVEMMVSNANDVLDQMQVSITVILALTFPIIIFIYFWLLPLENRIKEEVIEISLKFP